jgi:penicillin amidase
MIPGLPFVAVGRNPDIAWGGTNLRAASSALYDVSAEDAIRESEQEIEVRWWFDRTMTRRDSSLGPIISDSPHLDPREGETIALRWMGHGASDEFSAMLKVNRASDWETFREAFESFAVSGQNMVYADRHGNIGKLMAVRLPHRSDGPPPDMILEPGADGADWSRRLGAHDLPSLFNPPEGVVVSANDPPGATSIPIGYFFSPDDRVRRMSELLEGPVGIAEAMAIQQDVFAPSSLALKDALIAAMEAFRFNDKASGEEWLFFDTLRKWDGFYRIESRGAAAFEIFLRHFVEALYDGRMEWDELEALLSVANVVSHVSHDLAKLAPERLESLLRDALERSAAAFDGIADWGAMHRLELRHPLSNMPLIGRRYRFADVPTAGSRQTLLKTSHGLSDERHRTSYGANARFVADLSDIDENYILLLGGQDGWLNSSTFLDQLPLWGAGDYIRLPLSRDGIEARFPHKTLLSPGDGRRAEGDR